MEYGDCEEPPAKRRRFFAESDKTPVKPTHSPSTDNADVPHAHTERDSAPPNPRSPLSERNVENTFNQAPLPSIQPPRPPPPSPPAGQSASMAFDRATFESFVGDAVKPEVLEIIQQHCGNNIERAVNMYFDGTWKNLKKKALAFAAIQQRSTRPPAAKPVTPSAEEPARVETYTHMPRSRYIGAFGVEGWATRSGSNLLKHGDLVKIERRAVQPRQVGKRSNVAPKKVDVVVRFTDTRGVEIGRLARDAANWVSTLIDQKVCKFEGSCVYAPEKLRTNDTIFLQLRCSLLQSAFFARGFQLGPDRKVSPFEQDETTEERDLRLRQVALVRLFQEINLDPTKTNAASAKDRRQGLLEAAELAEKGNTKPTDGENPNTLTPPDEQEDGQELEQDQLDTLYKKAQTFDFNTPEAEPAESFAMTLRPYQKQSLHWMLAKEKNERNEDREASMNPLWEEYTWPTRDYDDKELPQVANQAVFYVNPYSGDLSLDFPRQEQHCLGGILADEMGLGKTIQMLSLIHSHKSEVAMAARRATAEPPSVNSLRRLASGSPSVVDAPCTTLVVAPMSLLSQWQSEAENASKDGTLKSIVYYGAEKNIDLRDLCCEANAASAPDVIITSYGVVLSEFGQIASKNGDRGTHNGIFSLNFFRVILDEAHTIKNRQSKTAKACYEIAAEHRWVLTGTPIVNRLEDLFSLVRFLRVEPWNNFAFWRTFITVPFESKNFMRALDVVQTVLEPLVMRRTKDMRTPDGKLLVPLPPKSIEIVDVELSEAERAVYNYVFSRAKQSFDANVEAGTVMRAFTSIFAQILRLRQTCCHPMLVRNQEIVADEVEAAALADAATGLADDMDLQSLIERFTATTDDEADANTFGAHVLQQIRDEAENECPICAEEPMIEQTVTGCWHSACKKCLLGYIKHQVEQNEVPKCFQCRETLNTRDIFEVVRHDDDLIGTPTHQAPRISLQRVGTNDSSAKIVSLISHLRALRKENPTIKSVVFSQFTSFLSLIEPALNRANMKFLRLDGTMAQKTRAAVLTEFRESKQFTVLLISLRAGGVGLNLTSAKRVFMMDPWWSFAIEAQAIDRVHRMGQEDEVKVYRFIVKESVEQRMLRIQERKKFIASSLGMMSDEEKKMQRIEDIKELLS
ncbi:SNF2 family N-terminal domain-containing protein [Coniochaeta sp. 2T2.1]|nr:SNF2 family N-terminal domain-containing protein [Coniochaeta sp. 2T2.1]